MIYSRSFCDAMLARVVSAYECMGEVTQLLSGFAQVTQLLCDLGRRARPSSPSHATHNDPGILVFVTSGSFFYPPSSPLVVVVYTCRVVCMNTPRGGGSIGSTQGFLSQRSPSIFDPLFYLIPNSLSLLPLLPLALQCSYANHECEVE